MIRVHDLKDPQFQRDPLLVKAEELADLIGPLSTRKDRVKVVREWLDQEALKLSHRGLLQPRVD